MRLLKVSEDGDISLVYFPKHLPPYAILSHTWGEEEVIYEDVLRMTDEVKQKKGYEKISFCAGQALSDGLQFLWIDTCCIDKSNVPELREALNSMFRYYKEAAKCYTYLSDIRSHDDSGKSQQQEVAQTALQTSRWFTRGWTLQELLAPQSVDFFSKEGDHLGNRISLEAQIMEATGIPLQALRGEDLSTFSVSERMAWVEKRETKEPEDLAYCLLGIFNVMMSPHYGEGKDKAMTRLRIKINEFRLQERHDGRSVPFMVPFEINTNFTGRKEELDKILPKLIRQERTTRLAIVGLGGVGKTQLALELVYRVRKRNPHCLVVWIPMISKESCEQATRDAVLQLCLPGSENDKADFRQLLFAHLSEERAGRWLLVFDNADDIEMWTTSEANAIGAKTLEQSLPKNKHGCIIFTTRDRKAAVKLAKENVIELQAMKDDAAEELLRRRLINQSLLDDRDATMTLLGRLTNLPLALVQAAAYINENSVTLAEYSSLLNEQGDDMIEILSEDFDEDGRYEEVQNPVATTWLVSFVQIKRHHPLAANYLSFMACISYKDVPQTLLPSGPSRKQEMDAVGTLCAYSFVRKQAANASLDVHRLVHLAMRNWMQREETLEHWSGEAIQRLETVFPDDAHENRVEWRRLTPHAAFVLRETPKYSHSQLWASLGLSYGMCQHQDGHYVAAEAVLKEAAQQSKRTLGEQDDLTLSCLSGVALALKEQGKYEEAQHFSQQVLAGYEKAYGSEHLSVTVCLHNLASLLREQGRHEEAEEMERRVLVRTEKALGYQHPNTLASMANLATTLSYQGKYEEAEGIERRVLVEQEKALGDQHPKTLMALANLACTLGYQGKYEEAEQLERRVLVGRKKTLGLQHPDTLTSLANLAVALNFQGKYEEAEEIGGQALVGREKLFGDHHPDTLMSLATLSGTLRYRERFDEAEEMARRALAGREMMFGHEHPSTLSSLMSLAFVLYGRQMYAEAEDVMKRALIGREKILGHEHPHTLKAVYDLAYLKSMQDDFATALELLERAYNGFVKKLGDGHPTTVRCREEYSALFESMNVE